MLLLSGAMPSFAHDAPLVLFRECPELAVQLARDILGLDIPPAPRVRVSEADFTQLVPAELRADLVIEAGGKEPMLGLVLEVQRAIDRRKPYVWPAYTAALHARLGCQTCLVVLPGNAQVAAWARQPIHTLQPGSPFRPLVLGPAEVPRMVEAADAVRSPELAVLSALVHGHGPGGARIAFAALDAIAALDEDRATLFHDLILGSLPQVMVHALEQMMLSRKYEYRSEFARRYFAEGRAEGEAKGRAEGEAKGRAEGLVDILRRRGLAMSDAEVERIRGCRDQTLLARWWDRALTASSIAELLGE